MGFRCDHDHFGRLGAKENWHQQFAEVEVAQMVYTKVSLKSLSRHTTGGGWG